MFSSANTISLYPGYTASIIPLMSLIQHRPQDVFFCSVVACNEDGSIDPQLNSDVNDLWALSQSGFQAWLNIFLVTKEPGSISDFTLFTCFWACNLNISGEGGRGGAKFLQVLCDSDVGHKEVCDREFIPRRTMNSDMNRSKAAVEWFDNWFSQSPDFSSALLDSWGILEVSY